jgi:hypothetical protein
VSSSFPTIVENVQPEEVPGNEPDPVEVPPPNSQSMVPNLDNTTTEVELVLQGIAGRKPLPPGLPAPSIRQTPIDDAAGNERVFAMAFPTLYPTGKADFNNPRIRKVGLRDYAQHLIRYQDGRFGRHPRWRFLIFNMIMRQWVFSTARFYVARNAGLKDLTREELVTTLEEDKFLLSHIVRQANVLSGTRPFGGPRAIACRPWLAFFRPNPLLYSSLLARPICSGRMYTGTSLTIRLYFRLRIMHDRV